MNDALETILQLAKLARDAHDSPLWRRDLDAACEAHGEACDALWAELYRQLDARSSAGDPVLKPPAPADPRKELKKQILYALKAELPDMVASIIDGF